MVGARRATFPDDLYSAYHRNKPLIYATPHY